MNKIIIVLFSLLVVALAEPPSSYGAPSFDSFSGGGGYSDDGGSDGDFVDAELLARVAQIIAQSEQRSSSSSSSRAYSPPSDSYGPPQRSYAPPSDSYGPPPSEEYGAPSRSGSSGSSISLGQPERAERVAEFDLSSSSGSRSGGYQRQSGGYQRQSGGYN